MRRADRLRNLYVLVGCLGLSACAVEELEVAYLSVEQVVVTPTSASGDLSADVSTVRVVAEAQSLGFYPLPAQVPVLGVGTRRILLEPVINPAGLRDQYEVYPMYETFATTLDLASGEVRDIAPEVSYRDEVRFAVVDDFSGSARALIIDADGDAATALARTADGDAQRANVGFVALTEEHPLLEVLTEEFALPASLQQLWLELDYRGDAVLSVAVLPALLTEPVDRRTYNQGVLPRDAYGKFYFDLARNATTVSAEAIRSGEVRLGLFAVWDSDGPAEQRLYLDNVKVLYR